MTRLEWCVLAYSIAAAIRLWGVLNEVERAFGTMSDTELTKLTKRETRIRKAFLRLSEVAHPALWWVTLCGAVLLASFGWPVAVARKMAAR